SGGLANAMLPALLFTLLKIDPTFGTPKASEILKGAMRLLIVLLLVLGAGLLNIFLAIPFPWGYLLPLAVLIISGFFLLRNLSLKKRDFILAVLVAVVSCLLSAIIGALGAVVGGKPLLAALIDPGIGWFAGDVVSAILGLFLLPLFTKRLQDAGIAR
ncbi:MAG: hypothetical protein ABFD58_00755, partial [Anaerolineaceae bacterium]